MEIRNKKKIALKPPHSFRDVKNTKHDAWSTLVRSVMVESQVRHARSFDSMIKKYEKEAALCKSDVLDICSYKVVIDHGSLQNTPVRTFGSFAKKFSPQPKKEKKTLQDLFFLLQKSCDPKELMRICRSSESSLSIFHDIHSELSNDLLSPKHSKVEDCLCASGEAELGLHSHYHSNMTPKKTTQSINCKSMTDEIILTQQCIKGQLQKKTSAGKSELKKKSGPNENTATSATILTQQNLKTSHEKKISTKKGDLSCSVLTNGARLTRQSSKALQQKKTVPEKRGLLWSSWSNGARLTRQSFKAAQQKKTSAWDDVVSEEDDSVSEETVGQDKDVKQKSNVISPTYFLERNKSPVVLIKKLAPLMLKNLQKDGLISTASVSHTVQRRSKRLSVQKSILKCRNQKITQTLKSKNLISFKATKANGISVDICNSSNNTSAITEPSVSNMRQSESNTFVLHEESSPSQKCAKMFVSARKVNELTGFKRSPENSANTIAKQDRMAVVDCNAEESGSLNFQAEASLQNDASGSRLDAILSSDESDVNCIKMNGTFTFAKRKSVDYKEKLSQNEQISFTSQHTRLHINNDDQSNSRPWQSEYANNATKELRCGDETNAKENVPVFANMLVSEMSNNGSCTGQNKVSPSETRVLSVSLKNMNNNCDYERNDLRNELKSFQRTDISVSENLTVSNMRQSESNTFVLHEESSTSQKCAKMFVSARKVNELTGIKRSPENSANTIAKQDRMAVVDCNAEESGSLDFQAEASLQNDASGSRLDAVLSSDENDVNCIKMNSTFTFAKRKSVDYQEKISQNKQISFTSQHTRMHINNDDQSSSRPWQSEYANNATKELRCGDETNAKENVPVFANMLVSEISDNGSPCTGQNKVSPSETGVLSVSLKNMNNCDYERNDLRNKLKSFQRTDSSVSENLISPVGNFKQDLSVSDDNFSICSDPQFFSAPMGVSTPISKYSSATYSTVSRTENKDRSEDILVQDCYALLKCKHLGVSAENNTVHGQNKRKSETTCPELTRNRSSMWNHCRTRDDEINFIAFSDDVESNKNNGNYSLSSEKTTFLTDSFDTQPNQSGDSLCKYKNLPLPNNSNLQSDSDVFSDMMNKISVRRNSKRSVVNNKVQQPNLAKTTSHHENSCSNANITTKTNYVNSTENDEMIRASRFIVNKFDEMMSVKICSDIKESDSNVSSRELVKQSCNYYSTQDDEINFIPLCYSADPAETNNVHPLPPTSNTYLSGSHKIISCVENNNTTVSPGKNLSECSVSKTKLGGFFDDSTTQSTARHRKRTANNNHSNIVSLPVEKKSFSSEGGADLGISSSDTMPTPTTLPEKCSPKRYGAQHVNTRGSPSNSKNITTQLNNKNCVLFHETVNSDNSDYTPCGVNEGRKCTESVRTNPLFPQKYLVTEDVVNLVTSHETVDTTEINSDHSLLSVNDDTDLLNSSIVTPSKAGRKGGLVCAHIIQKNISKSSSEVYHDVVDSVKPDSSISSSTIVSQKHGFKTVSYQSVDANGSPCNNTNITVQMGDINSVLANDSDSSALELSFCNNTRHNNLSINGLDAAQVNSSFTCKYVNTLDDEINYIPVLDSVAERNDHPQLLLVDNSALATNCGKMFSALRNNNESVFWCKDTSFLNENSSDAGSHSLCEIPKDRLIKNRKRTTVNNEPDEQNSDLSNFKLNSGMSSLTSIQKKPPKRIHVKIPSSQQVNASKNLRNSTDISTTQVEGINLIEIHEPLNSSFKHTVICSTEDDKEQQSKLFVKSSTKDVTHSIYSKTVPQSTSPKSYRFSARAHKSKLWSKTNDCEGTNSEKDFSHNKNFSTETDEINFIPLC